MEDIKKLFGETEKVFAYIKELKEIKSRSIWIFIWGIFSLVNGINHLQHSRLNLILIAMGVMMLVQGLAFMLKPRPSGLIAQGVTLIVVGLWNVVINLLPLDIGTYFVAGIIQIGFGISYIVKFKKFRHIWETRPNDETIEKVNLLTESILNPKPSKDKCIIRFRTSEFAGHKDWRARLFDEAAALIPHKKDRINIIGKSEITIEDKGKVFLFSDRKITGNIGEDKFKDGTMDAESMKNYQAWKSPHDSCATQTPTDGAGIPGHANDAKLLNG